MAGQEQQRPNRREEEPDDAPEVPSAPTTQARDEDVDAILDEIDDVLEENAEEFVRGYVQKGGQ